MIYVSFIIIIGLFDKLKDLSSYCWKCKSNSEPVLTLNIYIGKRFRDWVYKMLRSSLKPTIAKKSLVILENLKKELVDNWSLLNVNHLGDDSSFDLANPYYVPKWKHNKLKNCFVSFGQQKLKASWQVNYLDKLVLNVRMGTDVPPKQKNR